MIQTFSLHTNFGGTSLCYGKVLIIYLKLKKLVDRMHTLNKVIIWNPYCIETSCELVLSTTQNGVFARLLMRAGYRCYMTSGNLLVVVSPKVVPEQGTEATNPRYCKPWMPYFTTIFILCAERVLTILTSGPSWPLIGHKVYNYLVLVPHSSILQAAKPLLWPKSKVRISDGRIRHFVPS